MFRLSTVLILYWIRYGVSTGDFSCSNDTACRQAIGPHSQCSYNGPSSDGPSCACADYYYLSTGINPSCVECPGIGESCEDSSCCNQDYLVCYSGACMCIYNEYCWNVGDTERARFQRVAQCILAVALILTASILFILFWKACTRRSITHSRFQGLSSADSFLSLNSIQRLVLMQLQDRPPPYNSEYSHPWKNVTELAEPPPSYTEAVGVPEQTNGESNAAFYLGENPTSIIHTSTDGSSRPSDVSILSHNFSLDNSPPPQYIMSVTSSLPVSEEVTSQTGSNRRNNSEHQDASLTIQTNTELHI